MNSGKDVTDVLAEKLRATNGGTSIRKRNVKVSYDLVRILDILRDRVPMGDGKATKWESDGEVIERVIRNVYERAVNKASQPPDNKSS